MNLEGRIGEFKPAHFAIAMLLCLILGILIFRHLTFEVDTKTDQNASQKAQLQRLTEDVSDLKKQIEQEKTRGCAPQSAVGGQLDKSAKKTGKGTQK